MLWCFGGLVVSFDGQVALGGFGGWVVAWLAAWWFWWFSVFGGLEVLVGLQWFWWFVVLVIWWFLVCGGLLF